MSDDNHSNKQEEVEDNVTRGHYAVWFYETQIANEEWQNWIDEEVKVGRWDGDDLGDFINGMATLHSFAPNPRGFDPPIMPKDVGYPDMV